MGKFKKSQILKLLLLTALIFIAPFLSSSFRTTYLYFIINLLIFVVGAEAGLLSSISSKPPDEKKPGGADNISSKTAKPTCPVTTKDNYKHEDAEKAKTMRKSMSAKANYSVGIVKLDDKVNKSTSMPSIFFLGGEENEQEEEEAAVADFSAVNEEETDGISGQELFTKAEIFIGNFYKQLKMQREESWKRIHGVYQKAF